MPDEAPITREAFLARLRDLLTRTNAEDAELLLRVLELRLKNPFDRTCGGEGYHGCVRPLGHGGQHESSGGYRWGRLE